MRKEVLMKRLCIRAYRYVQRHIRRMLYSNRYYNWFVFSRRLSKEWKKTIESHYSCNPCVMVKGKKTVVFLCNGFVEHGGLADRLKGIVSTYAVCKDLGLDFRILFTSPFRLTDYLLPNGYNWQIDEKDVLFDSAVSEVVALEIGEETEWQGRKQYEYLRRHIGKSSASQVHVCTNAHFCYYGDFSALFHELFRPTPRLQSVVTDCISAMAPCYISVSARFIGNLGDFVDTQKADALPQKDRELLLGKCMEQVETLHRLHPECRILVCSDSEKFLNVAETLPYTYIYKGEIRHLDVPADECNYGTFEKTFVDFLLIAGAAEVFRLDTCWTHSSGFPYMASRVGSRPFHSIKFSV